MGCLGVHFAITPEEAGKLRSFADPEGGMEYLQEEIEEKYMNRARDEDLFVESDKAWYAIHRVLAGGSIGWEAGEYPLNQVIFGGESFSVENDYLISLKTPEQIRDVARALPEVTQEEFFRRYDRLPSDYAGPHNEEDREYSWSYFEAIRNFWLRVAGTDRVIVFSVDQ